SYSLDLLRDGKGYSWFEEIIEEERKAPADWNSVKTTIRAELKILNSNLEDNGLQLYDDAGLLIGLYDDGMASISIAGWGNWHTRASQVRMYLDVFEKHGFDAYDQQAEEKWKRGKSVEDITALLEEQGDFPDITSTGQGASLKPLSDADWDRMT